jgi:hypothetical protein
MRSRSVGLTPTKAPVVPAASPPPEWPPLALDEWLPTYATLHRWVQIVGKTRLALAPFVNHWWHSALYVTPLGLTTSSMPTDGRAIDAEFDFVNHVLTARASDGEVRTIELEKKSVADFYREWRELLGELGVEVRIFPRPNEIADATPFATDRAHGSYDAESVRKWFEALSSVDRVLKEFRGRFIGKVSPVHFWWGGFDLACTRFSGRRAPPHPGGIPNCPDYVMREGYSHECISAGWWPGTAGSPVAEAALYAYAYPEPAGTAAASIQPAAAFYHPEVREWILPYDAIRNASDPSGSIMAFLESTYKAAATLGRWDIEALAVDLAKKDR